MWKGGVEDYRCSKEMQFLEHGMGGQWGYRSQSEFNLTSMGFAEKPST